MVGNRIPARFQVFSGALQFTFSLRVHTLPLTRRRFRSQLPRQQAGAALREEPMRCRRAGAEERTA